MNKGLLLSAGIALVIWLAPSQSSWADNFRVRLHQTLNHDKPLASDVEAEIRFGRQVAARILGRQQTLNNDALIHYVSLVGTTLSFYSPRPELTYHFSIIDDPTVNAYSTPGGYIFITKGAIDLAQDEAELAAILAHEIAHVSEKHIVKELDIKGNDSDNFSSLAIFLGGSGNSSKVALSQSVDKAVAILFDTGYKITEELAADRVAILLLAQCGYDPSALERFLKRADTQPDQITAKSPPTHPRSAERFAQINALIDQENLVQSHYTTLKERFEQHVK